MIFSSHGWDENPFLSHGWDENTKQKKFHNSHKQRTTTTPTTINNIIKIVFKTLVSDKITSLYVYMLS